MGVFQTAVRPRRNKHSVLRLIQEIVAFNGRLKNPLSPSSQPMLNEALANVRRVTRHGSLIFLISDFHQFDETSLTHLRSIANHSSIVGIQVYDALEQTLPPPGRYTISNGTDRSQISTFNPKQRADFQQAFHSRSTLLADDFTRLRSPLLQIATDDSITATLADGLRHPGRSR